MKRKQVYLLLGLALALAIAGTIFQLVGSSGWKGQAGGLEPFNQLPVNSIEKLVIKSSKGSVTLQKVNGIWTVAERDGYPADFSKIRDLIRSIWEFKVVRELEVGASQFGRLHILPPDKGEEGGVQLDMLDGAGKLIKTLILGKSLASDQEQESEASDPSGRFVYDPSEKDKVYLSSESFYSVDPSPQNWLDKDFIKPEGVKEITRNSGGKAVGWEITRKDEKAQWTLTDLKPGETLDTATLGTLSSFTPSFDDVKPAKTPDSETGLNQPVVVNLATFDGFKYSLEIGGAGPNQSHFVRLKVSADLPATRTAEPNESADDKKKKDEDFTKGQDALKARLAAEQKLHGWIFQVPDWAVETLLKSRTDLVKLAAPSPKPSVRPIPQAPPVISPTPVATSSPTPLPSPTPEASVTSEASATPQGSASPETTPESIPSPSPSPSPTAESEKSN